MYLIYDTEFKLYLHAVVHEECIWTDEKSEALVVTPEQEKDYFWEFIPSNSDNLIYQGV